MSSLSTVVMINLMMTDNMRIESVKIFMVVLY